MTLLVSRPARDPGALLRELLPLVGVAEAGGGAPVDLEETDDAYIVEVDLPDVAADDVRIELRDNEIRVAGEYRRRERTGILRHQARRVGGFEYLVTLPGDVDPDAVEADLDSGVLTVRAPKARENQARRIELRKPPATPAAQAKRMREGLARPGPTSQPASQHVGSTGTGSTGQVGRSL